MAKKQDARHQLPQANSEVAATDRLRTELNSGFGKIGVELRYQKRHEFHALTT